MADDRKNVIDSNDDDGLEIVRKALCGGYWIKHIPGDSIPIIRYQGHSLRDEAEENAPMYYYLSSLSAMEYYCDGLNIHDYYEMQKTGEPIPAESSEQKGYEDSFWAYFEKQHQMFGKN